MGRDTLTAAGMRTTFSAGHFAAWLCAMQHLGTVNGSRGITYQFTTRGWCLFSFADSTCWWDACCEQTMQVSEPLCFLLHA
jgi:hypothetical protein